MTTTMQKILLAKCFTIEAAVQQDKINFELSDRALASSVPFVGRSAKDNGVVDYVSRVEDKINNGGTISIALDGSTGSTFYQHHEFCSGQNIWLLQPAEAFDEPMSPLIAMFVVASIRKAVHAYSYNLSLTKTRLKKVKILLPMTDGGKVDCDEIRKRMQRLRNIDHLEDIPATRCAT